MKASLSDIGVLVGRGARRVASGFVRKYGWLLLIFLTVVLDQATKWYAYHDLRPIVSKPLWQGVFHLTYVENRGAAFGLFADSRAVFLVISSIAIPALLIYLLIHPGKAPLIDTGLCFIIGGGIGNMIDRIALGYVIDFLDFALIDFAVFNVADSFVSVGTALVVLALLIEIIREERAAKESAAKEKEHSHDSDR